jgi:hypothetical protein
VPRSQVVVVRFGGGGWGEEGKVTQTMSTHMNKCKNNKNFLKEILNRLGPLWERD